LHIIAIGRLRTDQRTKDYVARRLAAAKGNQRLADRRLDKQKIRGSQYAAQALSGEVALQGANGVELYLGTLLRCGFVGSMGRSGNPPGGRAISN
jgi:hypothetical protein